MATCCGEKNGTQGLVSALTLRNVCGTVVCMLPITVIKDINYGPEPIVSRDPQRELDIYYSSSDSEDQPVILFVHGGAWRTGDKSEHSQLAENLARQGFTVAVNNYRLVGFLFN